jgi:malonyl-CoA/methylmalonyl-CoA synthetase
MTMALRGIQFPNDPLLVKLLQAACQTPSTKIIVFDDLGFERTYSDLLGDIIQTRNSLLPRLRGGGPCRTDHFQQESFVAILSCGGYEFLVAFFAIRAAGGVCVPLGKYSIVDGQCILISE